MARIASASPGTASRARSAASISAPRERCALLFLRVSTSDRKFGMLNSILAPGNSMARPPEASWSCSSSCSARSTKLARSCSVRAAQVDFAACSVVAMMALRCGPSKCPIACDGNTSRASAASCDHSCGVTRAAVFQSSVRLKLSTPDSSTLAPSSVMFRERSTSVNASLTCGSSPPCCTSEAKALADQPRPPWYS